VHRRTAILVVSPTNVFSLSLLYYFFFLLMRFFFSLSSLFSPHSFLFTRLVVVISLRPSSLSLSRSLCSLYDSCIHAHTPVMKNSDVVVFAVPYLTAVFLVYWFTNIYVKKTRHQNR